MGNADNPSSEVIARLKVEIAGLSDELRKALLDSVYAPMSESHREEYQKKTMKLRRLRQDLERVLRREHRRSDGQNPVPPEDAD